MRRFLPVNHALSYIRPDADASVGSWTAIAYPYVAGYTSAEGGNNSSIACPVPDGAQADDIAILVAGVDNGASAVITFPAGFTKAYNSGIASPAGHCAAIAWKRLTGADSGSYTVSHNWSVQDVTVGCVLVRMASTVSDPTFSENINTSNNTSPVSVSANALSPDSGDLLLWACVLDTDAAKACTDVVPPSGFAELIQVTGNIDWNCLAVASKSATASGSTGTVTGSATLSSGYAGYAAYLVRIPASAAAAPIYSTLDETSANDADYIEVAPLPSAGGSLTVTVKDTHSTALDIANNGGTFVTDSFTPANNSLLVYVATGQSNEASGNAHAQPTVSGGGLTWTCRGWVHRSQDSGGALAGIWTAPVTTGASMSVTLTNTDTTAGGQIINIAATVYEIAGYDQASPIGATLFTTTGSRSGAYSGTMSGSPAATSVVIAGVSEDDGTLTAGTGWTTDYNVTLDGYMGHIHQRKVGATAVEYDAITTGFSSAIVGIEIKAAPTDPPAENTTKLSLANPSVTPAMPFYVKYRVQSDDGTPDIKVRLLQGTTQIASWIETNVPTAWTTYERALTQGEFDAITNFNDLYIELTAIK